MRVTGQFPENISHRQIIVRKKMSRRSESLFGKLFYIWSNKKITPEEEFSKDFLILEIRRRKISEKNESTREKMPLLKGYSSIEKTQKHHDDREFRNRLKIEPLFWKDTF